MAITGWREFPAFVGGDGPLRPGIAQAGVGLRLVWVARHSHWSEWDSINSDGDSLLQPTNRR